uniref:Uncharacterized protein n=1 Tax=Anguilla anguilla TaxID=7936 RepID=A0A0E9PKY2_ANGAN
MTPLGARGRPGFGQRVGRRGWRLFRASLAIRLCGG